MPAKSVRVWVSRDAVEVVFSQVQMFLKKPVRADWVKELVAYRTEGRIAEVVGENFGLKPGECAEFEIRRVK